MDEVISPYFSNTTEYILRTLQVKKIPFNAYDLASDEAARRLWRRKAPPNKQEIPGYLVGNTYIGGFTEFENAVENGQIEVFLKVKDPYDHEVERIFATPAPEVKPIGVPGAQAPSEITGHKPSFAPGGKNKAVDKSQIYRYDQKLRPGEIDVSGELSGFGLEGVKVTQDELSELVASLGLEGKEAGDLVEGLSSASGSKEATRVEEKAEGSVSKSAKGVTPESALTADDSTAESKDAEEVAEKKEVEKKDDSASKAVDKE
ncbi:hypothetical protein FRC02_001481 [Tulasnella sp. 418]|nr:hypothetical protein FRC02_001481 [Tulasnella sp. 418]